VTRGSVESRRNSPAGGVATSTLNHPKRACSAMGGKPAVTPCPFAATDRVDRANGVSLPAAPSAAPLIKRQGPIRPCRLGQL
jgi:hypothetical protein